LRRLRFRGEGGNAVVEFIAFAVVLFAPLAAFAATMNTTAMQKQIVVSAAPQLARAASNGTSAFDELSKRYSVRYPGLKISSTVSDCCVTVSVGLGSARSVAKQVL
jgi:hypothetical protein